MTAVKYSIMPYGNTLSNRKHMLGIGMQGTIILHIAVLSNMDMILIPANDGMKPDRASLFQCYITYDGGIAGNIGFLIYGRSFIFIRS